MAHTMRDPRFCVTLPPEEDPNPACTRHVILKRPQASWSQSVFSVSVGEKIVPNRDYPYEGLSALLDGENYHFLDGLAMGVKQGDDYLKLAATAVTVSPWLASFTYRTEAGHHALSVQYYLMNTGAAQNGVTACVSVESTASKVAIEPLVDIRHMYEPSLPEEHICRALPNGLVIARAGNHIAIATPNDCTIRTGHRSIEWWYKLGSGFREPTERGVAFRGELRSLLVPGELELSMNDTGTALLIISCSDSESELKQRYSAAMAWQADEVAEQQRAERIIRALDRAGADPAVGFRALALARFGIYVNDVFFYEAGDFWFRTPWFRDIFEGIINNIEALTCIGQAETIKIMIRQAFAYQDEYGRIPNRLPARQGEKVDFSSADAILLAFIAAGALLSRSWDAGFASAMLQRAVFTISRFALNDQNRLNGAPVLHANGLLSVVPWHSWTDSSRMIELKGRKQAVSVRIPDSWLADLEDETAVNKPLYYLPEINAQWITMLRHCVMIAHKIGTDPGALLVHLEQAKATYKTVFWDHDTQFLRNVVTIQGKKDRTQGSPAIVAMALLLDEAIFSPHDVDQFIAVTKAHLLVERQGRPFGILVKHSPKRTYYGDEEYHEAVVWPRDTPYLIRLLRWCGESERETVAGLLQSNLAHQMDEGFVFYNSELFSPDDGAMTPVKNPIQFWSQWVDPFLER
ncbi:MAG: amylo-alpha-1,6-glucosidase [Candidatus Methanospirareceae archaeon]